LDFVNFGGFRGFQFLDPPELKGYLLNYLPGGETPRGWTDKGQKVHKSRLWCG